MDGKTILKSLAMGGLFAITALITEFLFIFNDDTMTDMNPGAAGLFVWHLLFFMGIVMMLLLQFRVASGGRAPRKFHAVLLSQVILLIVWFLLIIMKPLWLNGLAVVCAVLAAISVARTKTQANKDYLLGASVYILIICLCRLVMTTTYVVEG